MSNIKSLASCIFCRIVKGEIPCFKLLETDQILAFMDLGPIAEGHCLVIPKYHAAKLADLPEGQMDHIIPALAKIAKAAGNDNYNILQNNGRAAHQHVDHIHFHYIPKPSADKGLGVGWPQQSIPKDDIAKQYEEVKAKLAAQGGGANL